MASTEINTIRQEVKEYIDHADDRMLKIIHAILEADLENDWWEGLTDRQKASIEEGIKDMEEGNTIPHEEMVKFYSKWLTK